MGIYARYPWATAVQIQLGLVLACAAFNPVIQPIIHNIAAPDNWIMLDLLALACLSIGYYGASRPLVRWLSGTQFAVVSLLLMCLLGLIGTMILQQPEMGGFMAKIGLRDVYHSSPFSVTALMALVNLSMVIGRRVAIPKKGNGAFLCNHLGMVMVMIGMLAQSGAMREGLMQLHDGESGNLLISKSGSGIHLPAEITLDRFTIEEYPPVIVIGVMGTDGPQSTNQDPKWANERHRFKAQGLSVQIEEFIPSAVPTTVASHGADRKPGWRSGANGVPAARVVVSDSSGQQETVWLAMGSRTPGGEAQDAVLVGDNQYVQLTQSAPKSFLSKITVKPASQPAYKLDLLVNKPAYVDGWVLYQSSWGDDETGRYSVIMGVNDPTVPIVFAGLVMMVIGAFWAFWSKRTMASVEVSL